MVALNSLPQLGTIQDVLLPLTKSDKHGKFKVSFAHGKRYEVFTGEG